MRQPLIRVDPGGHEHGEALIDHPFDHRVSGPHVHDVELVDPGRYEQKWPLVHGRCAGFVLDQLQQFVFKHHLAGCDGDIHAGLEGVQIGHADLQLAAATLQVGE